jgi:nucleoside recognition membrane protein YjiH
MAENNNNGGKNTNIITKINDTISKVLGDFPPVVQTIAKVIVFGGIILLIAKAIGYIFPAVVNVLFSLLTSIVTIGILALIGSAFVYQVKLRMTRDENSFLLNERLKYQKKEYEERERRRQERDNRR